MLPLFYTGEEEVNFNDWINSEESDVWTTDGLDGARQAWNHQQAKINEIKKQLEAMQRKLKSISIDEIRPQHSEYDRGWMDCSITILKDLEEILK